MREALKAAIPEAQHMSQRKRHQHMLKSSFRGRIRARRVPEPPYQMNRATIN